MTDCYVVEPSHARKVLAAIAAQLTTKADRPRAR
jgi:hypothetical protein